MISRSPLRRYLAGAALARTGDEMSGPALLLLGVAGTGAVATGSGVVAALTAACAVGGPLVGLALDRSARPGRLLAMILVCYAVGLAVVAALLGHALLPAVGLALALGLLGPALSGGWTAQLPALVPGSHMFRATALDAMTFSTASLVGPALAGLVAATAGALASVVVAAVFIALAAGAALSLRAPARSVSSAPALRQLARGVRVLVRNRALFRVTAVTSVSLAGTAMLVVCVPVLGVGFLGGAENGAFLLSGMAVCSLLTNVVLARRPLPLGADTLVLVCVLVQACGLALACVASSLPVLLVAVALVGAVEGPQLTALFSVRHREAPERVRAQVFTVGASLKISAFALGAAVAGPLADLSAGLCLAVAAAVQLLAALVHAVVRPRRTSSVRRHRSR